ncbi:DUF202 domain-containing protein [Actinomadura sp. 3N508]|uniref:DUF202 domain-containing protein n=1 Tax=Actinomadura sp. 3N508 TaxID=3375153 RepID=UPI0037BA62B6
MRLWDPGAQPERTALAWSRTTLALVATGLLCVRLAPSVPGAAAAAAVVCGGAALQVRRSRASFHHRRRHLPEGSGAADPASVLLATALTILLAVTAVLLTL